MSKNKKFCQTLVMFPSTESRILVEDIEVHRCGKAEALDTPLKAGWREVLYPSVLIMMRQRQRDYAPRKAEM